MKTKTISFKEFNFFPVPKIVQMMDGWNNRSELQISERISEDNFTALISKAAEVDP